MKDFMKAIVMMVLLLGISSGTAWGDVTRTDVVDYDAYIMHIGAYDGLTTTGGGRPVGAFLRADGALFNERTIYKWDISDLPSSVSSAEIKFWISWTQLTGDLAGDIVISTFPTASPGTVVATDGGWDSAGSPIAPTASKVAFASDLGSPDGTYVTSVNVDVKDWLNAAIAGHLSNFSVRLSADYLQVDPAYSHLELGANPVSYGFSGTSYYAATLMTTVPEPATLMLLGLGALAAIPRRRRPVLK